MTNPLTRRADPRWLLLVLLGLIGCGGASEETKAPASPKHVAGGADSKATVSSASADGPLSTGSDAAVPEPRATRITVLAPLSGHDAPWVKQGMAGIEIAYELAAPKNLELELVDYGVSTDTMLRLLDEYCSAGASAAVILIDAGPVLDVGTHVEKGTCLVVDFYASSTAKSEVRMHTDGTVRDVLVHDPRAPASHPRLVRVPVVRGWGVREFASDTCDFTGEDSHDVLFVLDREMAVSRKDIDAAMRKEAPKKRFSVPHDPKRAFVRKWDFVVVDMTLPFDAAVAPIRAWMASRSIAPAVVCALVLPPADVDGILKGGDLCNPLIHAAFGAAASAHGFGPFGEVLGSRRRLVTGLAERSHPYAELLFAVYGEGVSAASEVAKSMYELGRKRGVYGPVVEK